MLIKKDSEEAGVGFVVWGLNLGLFVCFGVFSVTLEKPNFREVHPKPPALQDPWQSPACCLCLLGNPLCPTASTSAQVSSVPRRRRGKAEQLPLLSLCLLWFCLLGTQGMHKSIKEKEPNRSFVSVHDLRRAKEASPNQMVAFSPEKTALLPALPHRRQELQTLTARSGGRGWLEKGGLSQLKALK